MRTKQGTITSAKMTDTVTVTVHARKFHPKYKKSFRVSKKFLADSKGVDVGVGDLVVITETRPISKRKHFRVSEILKRAPRVSEMAEEASLTKVIEKKKHSSDSSDSSASSDSSKK